MEAMDADTGRNSELMVDGQFLYMGVVTLVNIKILSSGHTHTFFSFFFALGSIGAFVLFFYIMSLFEFFPEIFKLFSIVFTHSLCYTALVFVAGACILIDNGTHLVQYEIRIILED